MRAIFFIAKIMIYIYCLKIHEHYLLVIKANLSRTVTVIDNATTKYIRISSESHQHQQSLWKCCCEFRNSL